MDDRISFSLESELVQRFAESVSSWPETTDRSPLCIIGHEVSVPGGGRVGDRGSVDIMAVDTDGDLWLIEAKLRASAESTPEQVFGEQLVRYGRALAGRSLHEVHPRFRGYLFGRRSVLAPPDRLQRAWKESETLREALKAWLEVDGIVRRPGQQADRIVRAVDQQLRTGAFILALLTDRPTRQQQKWIADNGSGLRLALIKTTPVGHCSVEVAPGPMMAIGGCDGEPVALPPFDEIPQSFRPIPATVDLMFNEPSLRLYRDVLEPWLVATIGERTYFRPEAKSSSSTSFGYTVRMRNGLPLFLRIGRGDQHDAPGGWKPGAHTLKVVVNLLWAANQVRCLPAGNERRRRKRQLWGLVARLIDEAGYDIKGYQGIASCSGEVRDFFDQRLERTDELILERRRQDGRKDHGNSLEDVEDDAVNLSHLLAIVEDVLPDGRPVLVIKRPTRHLDIARRS